MNSHELSCNDYRLATDDMHMEMHRDTLLYLCICIAWIDLPFVSPMLDYSTDGRVCKAGMTSKGRCNTIYFCNYPYLELYFLLHLLDP